jgi:hypothetical protein
MKTIRKPKKNKKRKKTKKKSKIKYPSTTIETKIENIFSKLDKEFIFFRSGDKKQNAKNNKLFNEYFTQLKYKKLAEIFDPRKLPSEGGAPPKANQAKAGTLSACITNKPNGLIPKISSLMGRAAKGMMPTPTALMGPLKIFFKCFLNWLKSGLNEFINENIYNGCGRYVDAFEGDGLFGYYGRMDEDTVEDLHKKPLAELKEKYPWAEKYLRFPGSEKKGGGDGTDETKTDETKTDETKTDETKTDETKTDEEKFREELITLVKQKHCDDFHRLQYLSLRSWLSYVSVVNTLSAFIPTIMGLLFTFKAIAPDKFEGMKSVAGYEEASFVKT